MHALVVVSHPNPESFTHVVARELARGIAASGVANTHEFADLASEGFDPRFSAADHELHLQRTAPANDVACEHARLDRADALVLVYPVYWWSFPGMLKGWIDRVFTNGWAYEESAEGKLIKKLQRLSVHLVANAGASTRTYARHGYFGAMQTQIDHGIFGYCGAHVATSELLLPDGRTPQGQIDAAYAIGEKIFPSSQH